MSSNKSGFWNTLLHLVTEIIRALSKSSGGAGGQPPGQPKQKATWRTQPKPSGVADTYDSSPGQTGESATRDLTAAEIRKLSPKYQVERDGAPDPGEVVWTWVPYQEQNGEGKDRPVLLIDQLGPDSWAGCYLSTKHHDGFVSIGTGEWDSKGRESFLSPERVLRVTESGMRRESGGVTRDAFDRAVTEVKRYHRF